MRRAVRRHIRSAFALLIVALTSAFQPQTLSDDGTPQFDLTEVAPGVFVTQFRELRDRGEVGNSMLIVNDSDVVVVDSHNTPATARAVIAKLKAITPLPVRYVINTHWHGDHIFGNQAYLKAYPNVEFIAHPNTNADLVAEEMPGLAKWVSTGLPNEISDLERLLNSGKSRSGNPLTTEQRERVQRLIAHYTWLRTELLSVHPMTATMTVADSLVLRRGSRTILVRFLGRGNTRGDLTVFLPRERVFATGDLLVHPMPYAHGSYLAEWAQVLRRIRDEHADIIVPGHGLIQRDYAYLDLMVALLESTTNQARSAVAKGLDLDDTRGEVKLDSLRLQFAGPDADRQRVFDANYTTPAIERAWKEARGELKSER